MGVTVSTDTASLLKQREGRRGGLRSPELKMFSILERCDSDQEPEAFSQNDRTVWECVTCTQLERGGRGGRAQVSERHLINVSAQTNLHIRCGVCVLHNTHPDRFIIDGEPVLHIRPQPSIGQTPVALNFHWEPLHLKMEVRSLSPWHTGSETDQQALLKSFSSATLKQPSLTLCITWIWLFLTFAGCFSEFVVRNPNCSSLDLKMSIY